MLGVRPFPGLSAAANALSTSKFLAETANVENGLVILDTKSTVGIATYIDERAYLENEDDGYLENGNTYYMGVGTSELNTLISRHYGDKVVVNVSVSDLDRLCASINSEYSILTEGGCLLCHCCIIRPGKLFAGIFQEQGVYPAKHLLGQVRG